MTPSNGPLLFKPDSRFPPKRLADQRVCAEIPVVAPLRLGLKKGRQSVESVGCHGTESTIGYVYNLGLDFLLFNLISGDKSAKQMKNDAAMEDKVRWLQLPAWFKLLQHVINFAHITVTLCLNCKPNFNLRI